MARITYPARHLGAHGPTVSAIGYGAMTIGGTYYGQVNEDQALQALTYAADRGLTFWDTSDAYGPSEAIIGKWVGTTGRRSEIFLATKFGAVDQTPGVANPYKQNSKPSYMRRQVENSLKALCTDYVDLYYQHRVDPEVPIEVVMETLRPYLQAGRIRYIGLCECSIEVLKRAKSVAGVGEKIIAVQMEVSPFDLEVVRSGFLDAARELGVGIVAYSPLGRGACEGLITGRYKSQQDFAPDDVRQMMPRFSDKNFPKNLQLVEKFRAVGGKYNATAAQMALAWMVTTYPDIVPIPGTKDIYRLEENAKSAEIKLDMEDLKELNDAVHAADVAGARYPPEYASVFNDTCIRLDAWQVDFE
ncbi:Aldo/keto reductase [Heliocybe sulcata]|uniref:Aldo/keto reductase n=1 Tax=Heliocybe sulcata TaxID=5364 RepID=A0A5C3N1N0_9AGAM|nr:Aldo/keto reductase [Heliocybe sulcata]